MERLEGKTVYVSGAISSDPDYVRKFKFWADKAREVAKLVFNPVEFSPAGTSYDLCMEIDMALVRRSDTILVLPCHERSPGAMAQINYAKCLKKEIVYAVSLKL